MLQWDAASRLGPSIALVVFVLVVSLQIARKAGFGTGMVVLLSVSPPLGLVYLAFVEWPIQRRLRSRNSPLHAKTKTGNEVVPTQAEG